MRRTPTLVTAALAILVATPAHGSEPPWLTQQLVSVEDVATLVLTGSSGGRAGYDLAITDWNDDGFPDLVVAEPEVTVHSPELRPSAGRLGIVLGPLNAENLGGEPGAPAEVSIVDLAERELGLTLSGPTLGRLGFRVLADPLGPDGPPLAVTVPGATGVSQYAPEGSVTFHSGEVWILDGTAPEGAAPEAESFVTDALWWNADLNTDGIFMSLFGPQEIGYELARVPDLDGVPGDELAISVGSRLDAYDWEFPGEAYFNCGELLVAPGGELLDGVPAHAAAGWRLTGRTDDGENPMWGHAVGTTADGDLLLGNYSDAGVSGAVFHVERAALDPPPPVIVSDTYADLDVTQVGRALLGTGLSPDLEYLLATALAAEPTGSWLALSAVGGAQYETDPARALATVMPLEALTGLDVGEMPTVDEIGDRWLLLGSEVPFEEWTNVWKYLEYVWDFWTVTMIGATGEAWDRFEACVVPDASLDEVADCARPLIVELQATRKLWQDFPRSPAVPAWSGNQLLMGDPFHDASRGAVYVVTADLGAGEPRPVDLAQPADWPDGWSVTRIEGMDPGAWLGHTVLTPGDLDGDGIDDLVLSAPGDPRATALGWAPEGRVYLLLSETYTDGDGDGLSERTGDCDDADPTTYPGAEELCDGVDNDCNGTVDDPADLDEDGVDACHGDCDDLSPGVHEGLDEVTCDGLDNDCEAATEDAPDMDGDGYTVCPVCDEFGVCTAGTADCDDSDAGIHPGAEEVCDGVDNDCDGRADDGALCTRGCSCTDAGRLTEAALEQGLLIAVLCGLGLRRRWTRFPAGGC